MWEIAKRKHKTKTSNAERRERKVSSLKAQLEAAETRLSDIMGEVREANVGVDTALKVLEAIRSRATRVEREFDRNNARLKTVKVACRKSNSAANKSADAIWSDARARVPLAADVAPP
jgi:chromosome segregation ATPase